MITKTPIGDMNKDELLETFANNLRIRRIVMGITQKELADRAGIAVGSISAYEHAMKSPPVASAYTLAKALGTTLDKMFVPLSIDAGGDDI